ncbi:helix-turn-helix domain-containing protein [Actinoplanes sp. NPDC049265]|uniref:helix-turn-helix domain-containing protein n=1 Tax=Actinoplanes sp. NPDC049265 TaxID=3363902 RepID=UPI003718CBAA
MTATSASIGPPYKRGQRLTGDQLAFHRAYVIRAYRSGDTIRTIADATGRSYGAVHRLLTNSGVKLRQHGGPRATSRARQTDPRTPSAPATRRGARR